jgi:hypothetical protein
LLVDHTTTSDPSNWKGWSKRAIQNNSGERWNPFFISTNKKSTRQLYGGG